jgi:hypothetical protein
MVMEASPPWTNVAMVVMRSFGCKGFGRGADRWWVGEWWVGEGAASTMGGQRVGLVGQL